MNNQRLFQHTCRLSKRKAESPGWTWTGRRGWGYATSSPKKDKYNKWRLILDQRATASTMAFLKIWSYVSVDDVVLRIIQLGPGTMMAKMDIRHAYRNVLVHPAHRYKMGVQVDTVLPFGLRSAPLMHCNGSCSSEESHG